MTLTKSYHNSFRQWWSVYTWSLKKQSGIGIIYLILLCLALPFLLGIILFSSIKNQHMLTGENIANGLHILFTFLIIPGTLLFVFITAVLLFRFMHNKRSTDFYHALPVSRTAMFFGRFLAGFTILAVPMVICCCITAIVLVCVQGTANILGMPYGTLFLYLLYLLIIILITYAFTVFIAVCSGTTFNAIISAVAIGDCISNLYVPSNYHGKFIAAGLYTGRVYYHFNSRFSVYGIVCSCVFYSLYQPRNNYECRYDCLFCLVGMYYCCHDCCIMAIVSCQKK